MKYATFGFSTPNLGDDVQAIAAALVLPRVDDYVDRDNLDQMHLDEPHGLIMNSWFAVNRYTATPSPSILPRYFGFCVGRPELVNAKWLAEWKRRQPIGCRDLYSVDLLGAAGVEAHFTGCLTTWMGRFFRPPEKREGVLFIDVPDAMERFIPDSIRKRARRLTNWTAERNAPQFDRFRAAAAILDAIRAAEIVVTRRLHAALPSLSFGTPVTVYLENDEKNRRRFSGSDRILPIIFHDGKEPVDGPDWKEPAASDVTTEMEERFTALAEGLGATVAPRWNSVSELAATLPKTARKTPSFLRRVLGQ